MSKIRQERHDSKIDFYWDDNGVSLGYAYVEVDGFYYFMFPERRGGCWADYVLREIADTLSELNKGWEEEIEKANV